MSKFSIEAIFKAIDAFTGPVNAMEDRLLKFTSRTKRGLASMADFNSKIHGGIMRIAGAATVAGAGVGAVALNVGKAGASFDQQMADLAAVSLKSRGAIADLEAKARELGASTRFTATEVGAAMELMAKAGFENADILKGVGGMLAAAAAEGGDFAETAGHISNVLKGMGIETARAGEVADILALASVRTNSSISSLGESMSNVAATARDFKIPLKDVVAGVALLQDVGLDASVAGSAMNTMLIKLAKPTEGVRAKMRALGITFQDAKGNMLPLLSTIDARGRKLPGVFENMAKAAKKSGGNMKVAAFFADLVGLRGQKAASNFAELFSKGRFQELAAELAKAGGSAEQMASLRMDTLNGDIEQLGGVIDEMKIRLFDTQKGPLRGVVQETTKWLEANRELILTNVAGFIEGIVKNMPEIVKWMKRLGIGLAVFYTFAAAVKVAQTAIAGYEAFVASAALATKAWRLALAAHEKFQATRFRPSLVATSRSIAANTAQMELFGNASVATSGKLAGMRGALNASALGRSINGVTSLLGKAGLLGAAALVGYEFGSWLNTTLKLDERISALLAKMTGAGDKLNQLGGRRKTRGIGKNEVQELGDGTVVGPKGEVLKLGAATLTEQGDLAGAGARHVAAEQQKSFLRSEKSFEGMRMTPLMRQALAFQSARAHGRPAPPPMASPQVITSNEMIARSIKETRHTEKAEVTLKLPEGASGEVTKKPKSSGFNLKLQPSGAF